MFSADWVLDEGAVTKIMTKLDAPKCETLHQMPAGAGPHVDPPERTGPPAKRHRRSTSEFAGAVAARRIQLVPLDCDDPAANVAPTRPIMFVPIEGAAVELGGAGIHPAPCHTSAPTTRWSAHEHTIGARSHTELRNSEEGGVTADYNYKNPKGDGTPSNPS